MKRIVVELKGNLTFCGVDKGVLHIDERAGRLIETDVKSGLSIWCPETMIEKTFDVQVED